MARAGGWLKIVSDIRREGADSRPEKSLNQVWLLASPPLECNVLLVPDDRTALCVVTSARHFLALLQVRSGYLDPALVVSRTANLPVSARSRCDLANPVKEISVLGHCGQQGSPWQPSPPPNKCSRRGTNVHTATLGPP